MKIAVFGGMNMDICGRTDHPLRLRDSNIGHIQMQPGGVGRNIAARLAENGAKCELFTVLGSDAMSDTLRADCQKRGISLQHALCCEGGACVYLCMHDLDGDMLLAMNDMALTERLDCGYARSILPILAGFDLCVLDANAPADTLTFLAQDLKIPTLLDPVSCAKAERVRAALPHLTAIKPNIYEARALTGCDAPEACAGCAAGVYFSWSGGRDVRGRGGKRYRTGSPIHRRSQNRRGGCHVRRNRHGLGKR